MEEISIVTRQEVGFVSFDNFEELKSTLRRELAIYSAMVYSADNVKTAKKDKAALNKLRKAIEDRRKEIKRFIMVNIPGLGNRESGKMETGIPAGWKPLFR